ncbi:MAG: protein tyrosine phosphatase family protein [Pseudomonadota bacterium]
MRFLLLSCLFAANAFAAEAAINAPNVVPITGTLVTSGQPTADALAHLGEQGFGAVIYLAPTTVEDAVAGEAEIVRKQGLEWVNIPINFGKPTDEDVQAFFATMDKFKDKKVLVHCQVNMRASSMTFIYRTVVKHEKPELAYESVNKVWSPRGVWKQLIVTQLRKVNIPFEPY